MSMRGWRTSEPGDLGAGEAPQLLALAAAASSRSGVSVGTLSAEHRLARTDYQRPTSSKL